MVTKIERAFVTVDKKATEYISKNSLDLSKQYCMSRDQISQVEKAYKEGFLEGVRFKWFLITAESKVMKCNSKNCQSNYQDTIYGKGSRLFNPTDEGYRCTVCGNEVKKWLWKMKM